jgi:hypothetical protein
MKLHNIKNKLEERTIEVSENSWDKLASQLDANDKKKKRIGFYPYAACLALLVGFVIFMITKNVGNSVSETVVETETELNNTIPKVEMKEETIPTVIEKIIIKNNTIAIQESAPKVIDNEVVVSKSIPKEKEQLRKELQKEIQNAVVVNEKETSPKILETVIAQKEGAIDPNKELKASIIALSASEKVAITDEEIDALLKDAQKSIQHLNIQDTIDITTIVSADDLLYEVEYELDRSFKQKVFELIKSNIQKTRLVIADSN